MDMRLKICIHRLTILLAATSLFTLAGCEKKSPTDSSPTASIGTDIDDSVITLKIKTALMKDDNTNGFDINVTTSHGHVTLTGNVNSANQIGISTNLAQQIDGVKSVDNQLAVVAPEDGDTQITSQINSALVNDPELKYQRIVVETKNGKVELSGTVNNQVQVSRAINLAQGTHGVHTVVADRLKIR